MKLDKFRDEMADLVNRAMLKHKLGDGHATKAEIAEAMFAEHIRLQGISIAPETPAQPDSGLPAPDAPPEALVALESARSIIRDHEWTVPNDKDGHALDALDQLLQKIVPVAITDRDIPALLRAKAVAARHHAKAGRDSFSHYAILLDQAAEDLEKGLHEKVIVDHAEGLRAFFKDVHGRNVKAGWWNDLATGQPKKRSVGELFMLFVTEIAEAYQAYEENAADDKLPQYPGLGVELADLGIRWADFCGALQEGSIVVYSATRNPGDAMFREVCGIANRYEAIRKTDAAKGDDESGDFLPVGDVAEMTVAKLDFNANRPDHKIENRLKEDGKRT